MTSGLILNSPNVHIFLIAAPMTGSSTFSLSHRLVPRCGHGGMDLLRQPPMAALEAPHRGGAVVSTVRNGPTG